MAAIEKYSRIVREVLSKIASISYLNKGIEKEAIFDETHNRYALISIGWENDRRVHGQGCSILRLIF